MKLNLFVLSFLLLTGCQSKHSEVAFRNNLEALFSKEFRQNEPGGSILVMKGDKVIFQGNYGLANLQNKEPVTENTVFNLGSISKTFVANGILILEERGLLSTEDSIGRYFNNFKNQGIAGSVKIKHLLSHTSGLPDLRNVDENKEFYLTAKDRENFEPLLQADSLNFAPGEKFEYSNPAFNGLALIIEKITNNRWQKFITENIFQPSGMVSSKITDGAYPLDSVAHAYVLNEHAFAEFDYGEYPTFAAAGNGGIWSSVTELAKYKMAIRNNIFLNKQLTLESRKVFYPQNWNDTIQPFVGYSWFLGQDFLFRKKHTFDVDFVYHTGSQGGFQSFYIEIPEKDILLVGLFNRPVENYRKIILDINLLLEKYHWFDK